VIANAVASALGAEPHDLPLTPQTVWELARGAKRPAPSSPPGRRGEAP
jgi:hypothetical protein